MAAPTKSSSRSTRSSTSKKPPDPKPGGDVTLPPPHDYQVEYEQAMTALGEWGEAATVACDEILQQGLAAVGRIADGAAESAADAVATVAGAYQDGGGQHG